MPSSSTSNANIRHTTNLTDIIGVIFINLVRSSLAGQHLPIVRVPVSLLNSVFYLKTNFGELLPKLDENGSYES